MTWAGSLCAFALLPVVPAFLPRSVVNLIRKSKVAHTLYLRLCWFPHLGLRRRVLQAISRGLLKQCIFVNSQGIGKLVEVSQLPSKKGTRFVVVSDTHGHHDVLKTLPEGDVLVHSGDCLRRDSKRSDGPQRFREVAKWLRSQPHPTKLIVGGNHDRYLESLESTDPVFEGLKYCKNEGMVTENDCRIFLSPISSSNSPYSENIAFQNKLVENEFSENLKEFHFGGGDDGRLDVLVTHGPPRGFLDQGIGSDIVLQGTKMTRPKFHVFGHQHNAFGTATDATTIFVNASSCDGWFALVRPPVVFDVERDHEPPKRPSVTRIFDGRGNLRFETKETLLSS